MYVCMYVCTYVGMYVGMYVCTYAYTHITYIHIQRHTHTCVTHCVYNVHCSSSQENT